MHHLSPTKTTPTFVRTSPHAILPPYRAYEGFMTSNQTFVAEKTQEVATKLDGLIPSSVASIMLASAPPMLPRWPLTDPMPLDGQRTNTSRALTSTKSSKSFRGV